ncbi:hypothetical protein B0H13DRAFT_2315725 [Mycena leptocephala]|nr:hypothetical protein B0H13DRAFT_2315725 [Mycena leptocephala]
MDPSSRARPGRDFCFSFSIGACGITKRDQRYHHQQQQQQEQHLPLLLRGHLDLKHPSNRKSSADYKHGGAGRGREVAWRKHHGGRLLSPARMHWAQMGVPPQMPKDSVEPGVHPPHSTASTQYQELDDKRGNHDWFDSHPGYSRHDEYQRMGAASLVRALVYGVLVHPGEVLVRRLRAVVETSEVENLRVRVGGREVKAKEACRGLIRCVCVLGSISGLWTGTMLASAIKRPRLGYWRPASLTFLGRVSHEGVGCFSLGLLPRCLYPLSSPFNGEPAFEKRI